MWFIDRYAEGFEKQYDDRIYKGKEDLEFERI
jgi:hypothetical protein